jgi:hypothetical protein
MNDSQSNPADQAAVNFVETEVVRARASLRRTQLWTAASILVVLAYMISVTVTLHRRLLQPKPAAEVVTHYVSNYVAENGPALSRQLIHDIPAAVSHVPDYAMAQLPALRGDIEVKIEKLVTDYNREVTPKLGAVIDEFLVQNQDRVHRLISSASDPKAVHELGAQLEARALEGLYTKGDKGASAMDRIIQSAQAMKLAEERLNRLAFAKDLTPEEKQWRRVWGLILQQANRTQKS